MQKDIDKMAILAGNVWKYLWKKIEKSNMQEI